MRTFENPGRRYQFGVFTLDTESGELFKNDQKIKLSGQPIQVLSKLLQHPGSLVSREDLRGALWSEDTFVDYDHSLNEAVNKLRVALGDSASSPTFIATVPRRGYRFVAPVTVGNDAISLRSRGKRLARPVRVVVASMLGLGALVAVVLFRTQEDDARKRAVGEPLESLAVLPLVNLSGDPDQDYIVDGVTEELITSLAKIKGLRVISRTSAVRYRRTQKSLPEIAKELDVTELVEGSVRLVGDKVRVTVQLVEAASDRTIWAGSYEEKVEDLLELQRHLAEEIAQGIQVELTPADRRRLASADPVSLEAYQTYLRGRYFWNQRSREALEKAAELFRQAAEQAPGYARAHAGLADTYINLAVYNVMRHRDAMQGAKESALRALEVDPGLGEAHASLGCIQTLFEWDWDSAEKEFRRAIQLSPGYATAYQWYGILLVAMGRIDEAIVQIRTAQSLDPLSLSINENLGWALYCARDYEGAVEQFAKTLDLEPRFGPALRYLGLAYLRMGKRQEALAELEKAREISGGDIESQADLALAYALAGRQEEALRMLEHLVRLSRERYVSPYLIASFYAGLGVADEALKWLERAYEERVANLVFLEVDPFFDTMRKNPAFRELIARIGIPSR